MWQNIGRNEPCPCGSGKKYKHCHMRTSSPKEKMKLKVTEGVRGTDTHEEFVNGKWYTKPGRLAMRVRYASENDIHPELDEVIKPLQQGFSGDNIRQDKVNNLYHMLRGAKYHYNNFVKREDDVFAKFSNSYHGSDHDYEESDPILEYEPEAFLFKIKSSLDILAQLIGNVFGRVLITYGDRGNEIVTMLQNNCPAHLKMQATSIIAIVEKNRKWVNDVVDMRVQVTHYSNLQGFTCILRHTWLEGDRADVSPASMPDGESARKYMERTLKNLLDLLKEITPFLLNRSKGGSTNEDTK